MLLLAIGVTPASADHSSGELGVPGLSERQLRAFERSVLGPAHAAEHARVRRAERSGELPPARRLSRVERDRCCRPCWTPGAGRSLGRPVLDSGDGHPCRDVADRQGDVVFVSQEPDHASRRRRGKRSEHRAGMAMGPRHGIHQTGRSAALARSPRWRPEAGKYLVWRSDVHRRWAAGGVRRQPALLGPRGAGRPAGLHGPQQGLHVQSLERDLDRAARYASRALVSDRGQDAGRTHRGRRRSRRERRGLQAQHGCGAVHALGGPQWARHRQPAGHVGRGGQPARRGSLPAHVLDAVRPNPRGGSLPRGHVVPQPARSLELLHLA